VSDELANAIRLLAARTSLTEEQSAGAFNEVMRGASTPTQIAALLIGLRVKGETADEVAGAVRALRAAMQPVQVRDPDSLVDTCGTGGGAVGTFNISTAAAFVAAGAGVRVAKHGNRSFTSKCGSADVLEALGIAIDTPPAALPQILERAGMMFMFAPTMHPAMRHVGPVRRELGVPTVMNIVGPLANPAGVLRQVIGVADPGRLRLIAETLQRLGALHALVVHGTPGMDELSPLGPSTVLEVRGGSIREWTLDPESFGLTAPDASELAGGDPAANAALIEQVLRGHGPPGAKNAVILNAAGALYVGGAAADMGGAVDLARQTLSAGRGRETLEKLRAVARASSQ
jgi:anthranilate phosphoribosyltransferase